MWGSPKVEQGSEPCDQPLPRRLNSVTLTETPQRFLDASGHLRKHYAIVVIMRWGLLITIAVLNTALLLIGFRYWQMLAIDAGGALFWLVLTGLRKHHAPAMFAARIAGALFDLGLDAKKLDDRLHKKLHIETLAVFGATKGKYSHHHFAVRFFVHSLIEIEHAQYQAVVNDGALTRSIAVIRAWAQDGKIPTDVADREIDRIERFLVDSLDLPRFGGH